MIHDVKVKPLACHQDQRGWLTELARCDDPQLAKFGQAYVTATYPGVVKAWHRHLRQADLITCVAGTILLVCHDDRQGSPSLGQTDEFYLGPRAMQRVLVPAGVLHGWKCVSPQEALVVNVVTEPYDHTNPDEERLEPHSPQVPYDWARRDG